MQTRSLISLLLATTLVGCERHGHNGGPSTPPGPPVFFEIEPNDSPYEGDFIGYTDSYSHLIVEAHLDAAPAPFYDEYDHFEFVSDEPAEYEFWVDPEKPWVDMAVGVFDLDIGEMVLWWDSASQVEYGSFIVHDPGKRYVMVITSYGDDGYYDLELAGLPYPFGAARFGAEQTGIEAGDGAPLEGDAAREAMHELEAAKAVTAELFATLKR